MGHDPDRILPQQDLQVEQVVKEILELSSNYDDSHLLNFTEPRMIFEIGNKSRLLTGRKHGDDS